MVHTLEAIKGGEGSIKVGTTGTISSLMSRELESMKHAPRMAVPSRDKSSAATILAPGGVTSPKRPRPRSSANEASSSRSSGFNEKAKQYTRKTQNIPIVKSGRTWASPIANRLKKLSFSKLSESIN